MKYAVRLLALALASLAFAQGHGNPWPPPFPWTQTLRGQNGGTARMFIPAHDQTLPPPNGSHTDVTYDFAYVYTITNLTASPQVVWLNATGAAVGVRITDPQGSIIGNVSVPLPFTPWNVPPFSTIGPASVLSVGNTIGGQTSLGSTTDFDGPAGSQVQNTVSFPTRFSVIQSGGCVVQQHVIVSATVSIAY